MNLNSARYLLLLLLTSIATANDSFYVTCNESCSTCGVKQGCEPGVTPYNITVTAENADKAEQNVEAGGHINCTATVTNSTAPGGNATANTTPGLTLLNFKREGLIFDGVSPDYVKYETVTETVNTVALTVKKPIQLPGKHSTFFYIDLPDGSGFQSSLYLNSQLSARNANGLRTIPVGAQPISVTTYRHPSDKPNTDLTTLDVIHKQRHPQTGAWVIRTIRRFCPQGYGDAQRVWITTFFLGDPNQSPLIQSYREITTSRTPNTGNVTEEHTREITQDRASDGTLVTTSDVSVTYGFYKYGSPVKLAETKHTGTGSELTTTWTFYKNPADQASFNKPATMRRSDDQWANYTYQGNPIVGTLVTKTVSGWLDNPAPAIGTAPDENANRVVIEFEGKNETGTIGREEKIQGVIVSRTWGDRYKAASGEVIEKSQEQRGAATLTTIRTGYPDNDLTPAVERGRLKSVQHPDGTVTLHRYQARGDNRVETIDSGVGTLAAVTDGTRTVSTYTKDDTLIAEVTSDVASGIEFSAKDAIAFDSSDRPTRWAHDHDPDDYSETLYGCCGIDSERTRDGVITTYTHDALKRLKTTISQGVALTYTYGKKTIGGTDFPSVNITATSGTLSLDKGTSVYDHAGNVIQQISPDLDGDGNEEIATITRSYTARTTTTTYPDGGTVIETHFADDQAKSTTGTATAPRHFSYTIHNEQGGGLVIASAPTATGPWTKDYKHVGGQAFKTTFANGSTELTLQSSGFDQLGRVDSTTDADNVTQFLAYNARGEAYRRAVDLNQNGQIDSADRVTETLRDVLPVQGFGPAIRARSIIYDLSNNPITASTTIQSPGGLTTRQEALGVANPSISTRASHLDHADGSWTETVTAPDGTKQVTSYTNWLPVTQSRLDTASNVLESITTGYDVLRRPETSTHSRTGLVTTFYAANGMVSSTDDHGRVIVYIYDSMGRRASATLPDNSVTHTTYWPTGKEKASYGSQTNPTVKLYDPDGHLTELRTFRSTNLALAPDETTAGYDATTWYYNERNQLIRKQYADGKGTAYTYTPGGKLHTRTWGRSSVAQPMVTTYGYNTAGGLTTTTYSDDTTPNVLIAFDKLGRQTSVTNGLATTTYTYDPATLALDAETITYDLNRDFTRVLGRSRDNLGRDTGWALKGGTGGPPVSLPDAQAIYSYEATDGRLSTVSNGTASFRYDYLPNSNLVEHVIATSGAIHDVHNTWEPTRDVLASKQNKAGTSVVSQYDYTVNALRQRTAVGQTGTAFPATPSWVWGYDSLGQVTSADHSGTDAFDRAYQYDAIGNRIEARSGVTAVTGTPNYTANSLNQYTSVPSVPLVPSFDDDGNMTSGPLPAYPSANSTLTWDAENRLISTTVNGVTSTYQYDSQSRRISQTTGGNTTIYVYDAWNPIAEYSATTLVKTYTWGMDLSGSMQGAGGVGGLLAVTDSTGTHYPTYDGNGNVSEYVDATGAIAAHYEYDPFGRETVANGPKAADFAHRFSTKPVDSATGLLYYSYRYYDPQTGRWPSRDPIEEEGGLNLYGFVGNNGINGVDNLGLNEIIDQYDNSNVSIDSDYFRYQFDMPDWLLRVGKKVGLHRLSARVFGDWSVYKGCCNGKSDVNSHSLSITGQIENEYGSPEFDLGAYKVRLGWYGRLNATASLSLQYLGCSKEWRISGPKCVTVSGELGLLAQITDAAHWAPNATAGARGGAKPSYKICAECSGSSCNITGQFSFFIGYRFWARAGKWEYGFQDSWGATGPKHTITTIGGD